MKLLVRLYHPNLILHLHRHMSQYLVL